MEFNEYDRSYILSDELEFSNVRDLDKLESYVDYAIHETIKNQIPSAEENEEKEHANLIFTRFIGGDFKAFTAEQNIRYNMVSIPVKRFNQMLLKNAIEVTAYTHSGHNLDSINKDDLIICSDITSRMIDDEYKEASNLIANDHEYRRAAVNVYINFKYGNKNKERITNMSYDRSISEAAFGLRNLNTIMETKLGVKHK